MVRLDHTFDLVWNTYYYLLNSNTPACRRLVGRVFAPRELPSLIEAAFLSKDECDTIRGLLGADAQSFIDVIDEARSTFFAIVNLLIEIDAFCRLGTGQGRPFAMGPKEMSKIIVQNVWPPRIPSEGLEGPCLLRQNRRRTIQGRVCRCVEGGTLRPGCRCKGHKGVFKQ